MRTDSETNGFNSSSATGRKSSSVTGDHRSYAGPRYEVGPNKR